jgi:phosphohistidine phosphatase
MRQARAIGRLLKQSNTQFDAIYSSPLVRAWQTAEIVLRTCSSADHPAKPLSAKALLNDTSASQFARWLESLPEANHVLLVGHAPTLDERLSRLLRLRGPDTIKLPKGGLACVETEDRRAGTLKFLIHPKLLGVE